MSSDKPRYKRGPEQRDYKRLLFWLSPEEVATWRADAARAGMRSVDYLRLIWQHYKASGQRSN